MQKPVLLIISETANQEVGMSEYCVVVANGARARFFVLRDTAIPELEGGPNLIEHGADMINPEKELPDRELFRNEAGRNRAPAGGPAHGYDDHREQHDEEFVRRFARRIAEETARRAHACQAPQVVLVAQKRTLGYLRPALDSFLRNGFEVREVAKDLSKLTPTELHEHLARDKALPRRKAPIT
jgi:protein required for attachment to host cells